MDNQIGDEASTLSMGSRKGIALIAHDNCKTDIPDWAQFNRDTLGRHQLYATGTTGTLLMKALDVPVTRFLSGAPGVLSRDRRRRSCVAAHGGAITTLASRVVTAYVSCWPDTGIAHTRIIELTAPACRIRTHERGARVYLWEMLPNRAGIGGQEITMAADRPAPGAPARV